MSGKNENKKRRFNAWKRYGVVFMAGIFMAGAAAGTGIAVNPAVVQAEEEEQRITLNVAEEDEEKQEEETEKEEKKEEKDSEDKNEEKEAADAEAEAQAEEAEDEKEDKADTLEAVETGNASVTVTDVSEIVENCLPSVVSITNTAEQESETYYGMEEYENKNTTSGIIIGQNEEELLIAASSDVAAGQDDIEVWFAVGSEDAQGVSARVKGTDKSLGLCVVAVPLADIPDDVLSQVKSAVFGESADVKAGQAVIAVGSEPEFGATVTTGIVSAAGRQKEIGSLDAELMVIDASIGESSSGGAVLNEKGEVIGIIVNDNGALASEGKGCAVAIDAAVPVLESLSNKETRDKITSEERGYLGATVVNVNDDAKELYDMPEGAFVYEVDEGSAADEAGIRKGDIITKFGGESVASSDDLIDKISYYAVGETVTVELQTANNGGYESREVEVTLQEGSEEAIEMNRENSDELQEPDGQDSGEGSEDIPFEEDMGQLPFGFGEGNSGNGKF